MEAESYSPRRGGRPWETFLEGIRLGVQHGPLPIGDGRPDYCWYPPTAASAFRLDRMNMTSVSPRQNDGAPEELFCCCTRFQTPLSCVSSALLEQASS